MKRLAAIGISVLLVVLAFPAASTAQPAITPDQYLNYSVVDIGAPIPDNSTTGYEDWFGVGGFGQIVDLNVSVAINHTWVGDVKVVLKHDDTGTAVTIIDRPGEPASFFGCSGNNIDATLDDAAVSPVENECALTEPTIAGTFSPNNPLSAFNGESLHGTWRLIVTDNAGGDTGSLESWTLHFGVMLCDGKVATKVGTPGDDTIFATPSDDVIVGLAGADTITGGEGDDTICAGAGADIVYGNGGADVIIGGSGPDIINGGPGADVIKGVKGKDVLIGGPGVDELIGGGGKDTADYSGATSGVTVDLSMGTASGDGHDSISGVENVTGSDYADTITGDDGRNKIRGGAGNDTLSGKGGKDLIYGEGDDDTISGNGGADDLRGGQGYDSTDGGAGTDTCSAEVETHCELALVA